MSKSILDTLYALPPPNRQRAPDKKMQVLCLGLSRSGTDSLRSALLHLGYRDVYHGFVITAKQRNDAAFWDPLMREKFNSDDPWRPLEQDIDFDSVLGNCEAVTDGPANAFGPELIKYYPDAKVILNRRRDLEAWEKSMRGTCLKAFSWPMWTFSWFDRRLYNLWQCFWGVMMGFYEGDFLKHGKEVAVKHYEKLEERLQQENREFLDWSVEDGWQPLCEFLGRPVPDIPFPNGNQGGGQFEQNMEEATKDMALNALWNMGFSLIGLPIVVYGTRYLFAR